MRSLRQNERTNLLSQYIDGAISDEDRRTAEELLAHDADARRELAELKVLAGLVGDSRRLEPDIGFWTRLSVRIQDEEREGQSLLPFPKRMLPIAASAVTVVVAVFGVLVMQNRGMVMEFFSKKSRAVKEAYEQTVLKGSILPLFASVDRDRALQFSLFGELPLDAKSHTALRVDENAQRGYRIQVGKRSTRDDASMTFDKFVKEMNPTPTQRRVIDSLLRFAQDRLASSVLVGEDNALAIDQNLPQLNRVMVTGIASCLEPPQRRKLERLLAVHEAPYAVSMDRAEPAMPPQEVYSGLRLMRQSNRFMVVTPDTTIYLQMQVDFDSLRRQMEMDMQRFEEQRQAVFQRIESGEFRRAMRPGFTSSPQVNGVDGEFLHIEIGTGPETLPGEVRLMVSPRLRRAPMPPGMQQGEVHIRVFRGQQGSATRTDSSPSRLTPGDSAAPRPVLPPAKRNPEPSGIEPLE